MVQFLNVSSCHYLFIVINVNPFQSYLLAPTCVRLKTWNESWEMCHWMMLPLCPLPTMLLWLCWVKVITMENPVSSAVIAGPPQTDSPHALTVLRVPSAHNDSMLCGLPQAVLSHIKWRAIREHLGWGRWGLVPRDEVSLHCRNCDDWAFLIIRPCLYSELSEGPAAPGDKSSVC